MDRIKGITIGGKSFYFNVNMTKSKVAYLTVVGKKGNDEEKLVLFDSQIPSFIHKMMEAYGEICRVNEVPLFSSARPAQIAGVEPTEGKTKADLATIKCPECGTGVYDPNAEDSYNYLHIFKTGEGYDKVAVTCKQCGWHPESAIVSETNGAVFYRSSEQGMYWEKYATW